MKENTTMTTLLTYDNLEGRNTRDVLKRLTTAAMDRLREEANNIWAVMEHPNTQAIEEYSTIWNTPVASIPKKTIIPGKKFALQTPREYIEGFREKINRQRFGTDLSKKQIDGFYNFHYWFAKEFEIEEILFVERDVLLQRTNSLQDLKNICTIL